MLSNKQIFVFLALSSFFFMLFSLSASPIKTGYPKEIIIQKSIDKKIKLNFPLLQFDSATWVCTSHSGPRCSIKYSGYELNGALQIGDSNYDMTVNLEGRFVLGNSTTVSAEVFREFNNKPFSWDDIDTIKNLEISGKLYKGLNLQVNGWLKEQTTKVHISYFVKFVANGTIKNKFTAHNGMFEMAGNVISFHDL